MAGSPYYLRSTRCRERFSTIDKVRSSFNDGAGFAGIFCIQRLAGGDLVACTNSIGIADVINPEHEIRPLVRVVGKSGVSRLDGVMQPGIDTGDAVKVVCGGCWSRVPGRVCDWCSAWRGSRHIVFFCASKLKDQ